MTDEPISPETQDTEQAFQKPKKQISIHQSSISKLFSVLILLTGVFLVFIFWFHHHNAWSLFLTSFLMLLPVIGKHFVPSHWQDFAEKTSLDIKYVSSDVEILLYVASYIFLAPAIFLCFMSIIPSYVGTQMSISIWLGLVIGVIGVWVISTIYQIIGEFLGHMFPKK